MPAQVDYPPRPVEVMPFLLRIELVDDERGSRLDGFEVRFETPEMARSLLTLVRKNASYSGRVVAELGAPVDASRVRTRLLDRMEKKPEGTAAPGAGGTAASALRPPATPPSESALLRLRRRPPAP